MDKISDLVKKLDKGSANALARLITMVENEQPEAMDVLRMLYPKTGNAYIVGITGPPGSGKSTLVDGLVRQLRKHDHTVGIIAIDPSSPFSGGALMGDRLRMQEFMDDDGVFFRSMATRGTMGGLSRATTGCIELMDAFGRDYILLETVGVGQDELDIVRTADSTLLISVPGLGDEIQALKAGTMEIGDIYVVNKADRDGANMLAAELQLMCDMRIKSGSWSPPIIKTDAVTGQGIQELMDQILAHREHLESEQELQRRRHERIREKIIRLIECEISKQVHVVVENELALDDAVNRIVSRKDNPYSYARAITEPIAGYFQKGEAKNLGKEEDKKSGS